MFHILLYNIFTLLFHQQQSAPRTHLPRSLLPSVIGEDITYGQKASPGEKMCKK